MIVSSIFASTPKADFGYPIKFSIEMSQQKVLVGDIVDIIISAKLDEDHYHFKPQDKYVLVDQRNMLVYQFDEWNVPPHHLEEMIRYHNEEYSEDRGWEIIYSDEDAILDSIRKEINFSLKIKILKKPDVKYIKIPINIFKFDEIEEYAGYSNYVNNIKTRNPKETKHRSNLFYLEIEYNDSTLKDSGGYSFSAPALKITDEFPQNIKIMDPPIFDKPELFHDPNTVNEALINTTE